MREPRPDQADSSPQGLPEGATGSETDSAGFGLHGSDQLLALVYEELRSLARARMREIPPGQTLQPTALVHEVWVRIEGKRPEGWASRAEFFYAAARAMRDILVEDARRKGSLKRGGDRRRIVLDPGSDLAIEPPSEDVVALDEAISVLARDYPDAARVVSLRYFAGLTVDEVAEVMQISGSSVERAWRFARAWLRARLTVPEGDSGTEGAERD